VRSWVHICVFIYEVKCEIITSLEFWLNSFPCQSGSCFLLPVIHYRHPYPYPFSFFFFFIVLSGVIYTPLYIEDQDYVEYLQVIGWSMWFSEYLFLERSWAKDESTLKVWVYKNVFSIYVYMHKLNLHKYSYMYF